jgi:hypothetical protein
LQATSRYIIEPKKKRDFVEHQKLFSVIRRILGTLGLSPEATDDIIDRITDFLSDKGERREGAPGLPLHVEQGFSLADRAVEMTVRSPASSDTLFSE